jgi:phosphate uptake regulator
MKRKIVAQGNQSLTLTLPIKWVREQQLKAGDEIEVSQTGSELILRMEGKKKGGTYKIHITPETNNSKILISLLFAAYRSGADEIDVTYEPLELLDRNMGKVKTIECIQETVNVLIGVSIVEQTKNFCKIKDITGASEEEFENILRRTFLLILSLGEQSLKAFKEKDDNAFVDVPLIYESIRKFTEYSLRLLSKYDFKERENTGHYYSIVTSFDDISDELRHMTKHFAYARLSESNIAAYQNLYNYLRKTYEWFYKPTDQKLSAELFRLRDISHLSLYSAESWDNYRAMKRNPRGNRTAEVFMLRDTIHKGIYPIEAHKAIKEKNNGILESLQSIWAAASRLIKERMATLLPLAIGQKEED